jgi:hypothetical protein
VQFLQARVADGLIAQAKFYKAVREFNEQRCDERLACAWDESSIEAAAQRDADVRPSLHEQVWLRRS